MDDEKLLEQAERKRKDGWITTWMMIEALAVSEQAAKSALEKHLDKMRREDKTVIYKTSFGETRKVEKPLPMVPVGYSCVVELELVTQSYEKLFYLVLNYAPSGLEILEPERITLDAGEAQGILNSLADVLHRFASRGAGGVLVRT